MPIVPGTAGVLQNDQETAQGGHEIGYPLIVKAAAGGGGKGMRVVHTDAALLDAIRIAQSEAAAAFGQPDVYLEKYSRSRGTSSSRSSRIEHGHLIHLGERDCSVQRNHQKLVEESPVAALTQSLRTRSATQRSRPRGRRATRTPGTIEFLVDRNNSFYFLEMNTRIQVEHPVTEYVTGLDLVRAANPDRAGQPLRLHQRDVQIRGHAIECRINAEDPERNFAPSAGKIESVVLPGGLWRPRRQPHLRGYTVPTYYESLLAKLIVWGTDRREAIARMSRCFRNSRSRDSHDDPVPPAGDGECVVPPGRGVYQFRATADDA